MNKADALKRQSGLFDEFVKQLKEGEANYQIALAADNGVVDMAMVQHDEVGIDSDSVLGCYYFMPQVNEETEILQFVSAITISDETPEDRKQYMLQAVLYVNYFLSMGSFVYDADLDVLTFKRATNLICDLSDEQMLKMMGVEMTMALHSVSLYVAPLLRYMNDELSWENFVKTCQMVAGNN